jgi:hypothetical protein
MPIDSTPFGQDVVPFAAKVTDDPTVLPFPGLVTVTPANAEVPAKTKMIRKKIRVCFFIRTYLQVEFNSRLVNPFKAEGSHTGTQAGYPWIVLGR